MISSCHPIAYAERPSTENSDPPKLSPGDIIVVKFGEGPSYLGRQRVLTYDPFRVNRRVSKTNEKCKGRSGDFMNKPSDGNSGRLGPVSDNGGGSPAIKIGVQQSAYSGPDYEPALNAELPYTPRKNQGKPYEPTTPAKMIDFSKRGPDYNGPDGVAQFDWQVVGASYPTHPKRTIIGRLFGEQRSKSLHGGTDISGGNGIGEPMYAVLDGKVYRANCCSKSAGGHVIVVHKGKRKDGKDIEFLVHYMHCEAIYVKKNQEIKKGQHIADQGNTGNSYGAHLHFELWWGVNWYDWNGQQKYRVNPTVVLGLQYGYAGKAKKEVEAEGGGEKLAIGKAHIDGATGTTVSGG